jgi:hypothetical protein
VDGVSQQDNTDVARLSHLQHSDDTVLLAESAEDARLLVAALERWCSKWQISPNVLEDKCKVLVFENTGNSQPVIKLGNVPLKIVTSITYLGYVLTKRGTWTEHVSRRLEKAERWDGIARRVVGRVGGCPVSAAATVREATAEAAVLYGADLWSGASEAYGEMVDKHQTSIARAILGVKKSAERAGVLTELGWSNTSLKACTARLSLWWRIGWQPGS